MDLERENRLTRVEERTKSNTHRIDRLEPIVKEIHTMSETLVEMATEMRHTNKTVEAIKDKVDCLEDEPARKWKDSTKTFFNALLGAAGAAVAGGIMYLMTQ